nr:hypothetical protein [uncultured Desulfobacter sp.]
MQTIGNFNTQFELGLPAESYIKVIKEFSQKDGNYIYTCYLRLVQNVLKEVMINLGKIAQEDDMEKQDRAICHIPGINMARGMAMDCAILDKLINLFTIKVIENENGVIHDYLNEIVVNSDSNNMTDKETTASHLIVFFNHALIKINTLRNKNFIITGSINEYCLQNIRKALCCLYLPPSQDILMATRNLPEEVIFKAFGNHFKVEVNATHVYSLDRLRQFAYDHGQTIYDSFWRSGIDNQDTFYVEAVANVDDFINGLATTPYDKILQIVWYATHLFTESENISVRFLLKVPPPPSEAEYKDGNPLAILLKAAVDKYSNWIKDNESRSVKNLLIGLDIVVPEKSKQNEEKVKDLLNELHNRIFTGQNSLKVLHVNMNIMDDPYDDLAEMNRWIQQWRLIKAPWKTLNDQISYELVLNYGKSQRLDMAMDKDKLFEFCYGDLGLHTREKYPGFSLPLVSRNTDNFEKLKTDEEKCVRNVVSGYLQSIFVLNNTNTKLKLGYLTQVDDDTLKMIAGSEYICIDIIPWWSICCAVHFMGLTPRQFNTAKVLLFTKITSKADIDNLTLLKKTIEINAREKGETEAPGRTIIDHSPIGRILKITPTQFVLGNGESGIKDFGIIEEYSIFNRLITSPTSLEENVKKYRRFIVTKQPSTKSRWF